SLGGLDPTWALLCEDLDFGWRVNAAGGRVVAAPSAVVRHASALTRRLRTADPLVGPVGAAERAHGMQVVLANTSPWLVAPLFLRYLIESVVRALGLLVFRSPRGSRDEVLALA